MMKFIGAESSWRCSIRVQDVLTRCGEFGRCGLRAVAWMTLCGIAGSLGSTSVHAQELEPRRWSHLPIDRNFVAIGYARTNAQIAFDPALRIEDAVADIDIVSVGYIRTFKLFDRSARVEIRQAWQEGTWTGLVNGVSASVKRQGLADTITRFAVNLVGAPPLAGKEFAEYRAVTHTQTIVGAALAVHLPTGEYMEDKLINLGSNRFTVRPQFGDVHDRGAWSFEVSASAWLYTDNDSLFNGSRLEQDPLYTVQTHVTHTFSPGVWASASAAIGIGGRTTVSGRANDDRREDIVWAVAGGFPITRSLGFKAVYIDSHRRNAAGNESQTITFSLQTSW